MVCLVVFILMLQDGSDTFPNHEAVLDALPATESGRGGHLRPPHGVYSDFC